MGLYYYLGTELNLKRTKNGARTPFFPIKKKRISNPNSEFIGLSFSNCFFRFLGNEWISKFWDKMKFYKQLTVNLLLFQFLKKWDNLLRYCFSLITIQIRILLRFSQNFCLQILQLFHCNRTLRSILKTSTFFLEKTKKLIAKFSFLVE